jgi:hypothetical protein
VHKQKSDILAVGATIQQKYDGAAPQSSSTQPAPPAVAVAC